MPAHSGGDAKALMMFDAQKKSTGAAYLLWIFLGGAGGHRFYLGRVGTGTLMLLGLVIGLAGAPAVLLVVGLVAIIDAFRIPGWIRQHNTELAARLATAQTVAAPLMPQTPPPLPGIATGQRTKRTQGSEWTTQKAVSELSWNFVGAAALVFLIGVGYSLLSPKREAQTPLGNMPTEFAATLASHTQASPNTKWTAPPVSTGSLTPQESSPIGQIIIVPSDFKNASYYVEGLTKTKAGRPRIISRRNGLSGISFTHRECDCQNATYRTLGDGDTLDAMRASAPEHKMVKLVHDGTGFGSVSFHVCEHACKELSTPLNRAAAMTVPTGP